MSTNYAGSPRTCSTTEFADNGTMFDGNPLFSYDPLNCACIYSDAECDFKRIDRYASPQPASITLVLATDQLNAGLNIDTSVHSTPTFPELMKVSTNTLSKTVYIEETVTIVVCGAETFTLVATSPVVKNYVSSATTVDILTT